MTEGFSRVTEIKIGRTGDDRPAHRCATRCSSRSAIISSNRPPAAAPPVAGASRCPPRSLRARRSRRWRSLIPNFVRASAITSPPAPLASVGVMGSGSGATQSKYVARRETPVYIAENCTQCMECITACPDTALAETCPGSQRRPQDRNQTTTSTDSRTIAQKLGVEIAGLEQRARTKMNESVKAKTNAPFKDIIRFEVTALTTISEQSKAEFTGIIDKLPLSYSNVPAIFRSLEAKTAGAGGLFSISFPISARAAANACRSAAITTRSA